MSFLSTVTLFTAQFTGEFSECCMNRGGPEPLPFFFSFIFYHDYRVYLLEVYTKKISEVFPMCT